MNKNYYFWFMGILKDNLNWYIPHAVQYKTLRGMEDGYDRR